MTLDDGRHLRDLVQAAAYRFQKLLQALDDLEAFLYRDGDENGGRAQGPASASSDISSDEVADLIDLPF